MYVYRPQSMTVPGHAPGHSSSAGCRGAAQLGRQSAKAQRRTQPKRRPAGPGRGGRRSLQGLKARLGRKSLPLDGELAGRVAREPAQSESDAGAQKPPECRGVVRQRLQKRLVDRRSSELVAALGRRYGEAWAELVVQGSFEVGEAMGRLCEAYCLRPRLEQLLLQTVLARARVEPMAMEDDEGRETLSRQVTPAQMSLPAAEAPSEAERSDASSVLFRSRSDPFPLPFAARGVPGPEPDVEWSPTPSVCPSAPSSVAPSPKASPYITSQAIFDPPSLDELALGGAADIPSFDESTQAPDSNVQEQCTDEREDHSQPSSVEAEGREASSGRIPFSSLMLRRPPVMDAARHASDEAGGRPKRWSTLRMFRSLGLGCARRRPMEENEDCSEDEVLVAAARNARFQSAKPAHAETKPTPAKSDLQLKRSPRSTAVKFSSFGRIRFFEPAAGQSSVNEIYDRDVQTKFFDGPSGHKARRTNAEAAGKDLHVELSRGFKDGITDEGSESEDDDWEDKCDDIACLMSQQRHMLMWSCTWA